MNTIPKNWECSLCFSIFPTAANIDLFHYWSNKKILVPSAWTLDVYLPYSIIPGQYQSLTQLLSTTFLAYEKLMFWPNLQFSGKLTAFSLWCWKAKLIESVFLKSQWEAKKRSHTWLVVLETAVLLLVTKGWLRPYIIPGKSICSERTKPERNLSLNFKNHTGCLLSYL